MKDTASNPSICVLLAAYNGMEFIEEQVASILDQQNVDVTLFVSVDRSTDGTEVWIDKLSAVESRVKVLPHGEVYGEAGKNFFRLFLNVDFSAFDAVALADQDDVWLQTKLLDSYVLMKQLHVQAISADMIAIWPNGQRLLLRKSYPQQKYDHFFESPGAGCTFLLNRSVAIEFQRFLKKNIELIEDGTHHDWLIYAYCRSKGHPWHICSTPLVYYRQHGGNQIGANFGFRAYLDRLEMIRSGVYRQQVQGLIKLVSPEKLEGFQSYWFLLSNASHLRRRVRDKIILFIAILMRWY